MGVTDLPARVGEPGTLHELAHDRLVLGVHLGIGTRAYCHPGLLHAAHQFGGHVLVVERHGVAVLGEGQHRLLVQV